MTSSPVIDWRYCFEQEEKASVDIEVTKIEESKSRVSKILRSKKVMLGLPLLAVLVPTMVVDLDTVHATVQTLSTDNLAIYGKDLIVDSSLIVSNSGADIPAGLASPDSSEGWGNLINKILWIVDLLMDCVIIFAGVSWMFGNRTKAIELLMGSGIGYIIVRHHDDIKNFFAML